MPLRSEFCKRLFSLSCRAERFKLVSGNGRTEQVKSSSCCRTYQQAEAFLTFEFLNPGESLGTSRQAEAYRT